MASAKSFWTVVFAGDLEIDKTGGAHNKVMIGLVAIKPLEMTGRPALGLVSGNGQRFVAPRSQIAGICSLVAPRPGATRRTIISQTFSGKQSGRRKVITGSFNFTKAAEERNAENLLVIDDPKIVFKYMTNWQAHAAHSVVYGGDKSRY